MTDLVMQKQGVSIQHKVALEVVYKSEPLWPKSNGTPHCCGSFVLVSNQAIKQAAAARRSWCAVGHHLHSWPTKPVSAGQIQAALEVELVQIKNSALIGTNTLIALCCKVYQACAGMWPKWTATACLKMARHRHRHCHCQNDVSMYAGRPDEHKHCWVCCVRARHHFERAVSVMRDGSTKLKRLTG